MAIIGLNTMMQHLHDCNTQKSKYKTGYWSSINEYPIMFALMAFYRPARVIECGTCSGCSALSWAVGQHAAQLNPRVYTFDPADRAKVYAGTGWEEYIQFFNEPFVGDTAKNFMERKIHGDTFVFIDGNHVEEACYADAVQTFECVQPGMVVAFHDAVKYPPIQNAITEALTAAGKDPRRRYTIPSACGLEIVEF